MSRHVETDTQGRRVTKAKKTQTDFKTDRWLVILQMLLDYDFYQSSPFTTLRSVILKYLEDQKLPILALCTQLR